MIEIDPKFKGVLLEALQESMYKLSLDLSKMKGEPLTSNRRELSKKQALLEELQHIITVGE
ncbi:MAG: hypothetical protein HKN16_13220 [Saprospiraceae bacterium]|nr:hypothetical protein [Saprospiraceae bacterium]